MMKLTDPAVKDLNTIADWLSIDDLSELDNLQPDVLILAGHAIMPNIVGAVNFAANADIPVIFSGGIGHSTDLLREAVKCNAYIAASLKYSLNDSEARILADIAKMVFGIGADKIYLEDKSTNCGLNALFTRNLIQQEKLTARNIILVQDPLMQRRTWESFRFCWQQQNLAANFINWPVFKPRLKQVNGRYMITGGQLPGVWDLNRYISMTLGEVKRLRDDAGGYGPKGAGFIGHVTVPDVVAEAWQRLTYCTNLAGLVR
ncbi:YdcF family protein [Klebsiella huaxiensis]|uniref:DUF218 domain-containing protein n=1 Tax=Klebsiella huaxiensis TaxID=2153354 RepID=A0A564LNC3_9ENTR|nr:YdcF family protein [Klebsiella huaxiensis]VUS83102.1 hypothetical protein SB6422_02457 [Klebsiella huaxiensis]